MAVHHNSSKCDGEPGITAMLRASCISNVIVIMLSLSLNFNIECQQASF